MATTAFADELATDFEVDSAVETMDQLSVSSALADSEIYNYLNEHDELDGLYQAQEEIRDSYYETIATYANDSLGISEVSAEDMQYISEKYNLPFPNETESGVIDNGTINVQRDSRGNIIDVWYLYYTVSQSSFTVKAALIDADNPLDSVSGTIYRYCLNETTWRSKDSTTFNKMLVKNGTIYTWRVAVWGVKEKFEYDITVKDNFSTHYFYNEGEENYTRYNFEVKPYDAFTANGGHRHHFIPAKSLTDSGFISKTAYCIRMLAGDHRNTGSFGSATYVSEMTTLLKNQQYEDALQKEVDDFRSKADSEGIYGSLLDKYVDQVSLCLYYYEKLFGLIN